MLPVDRETGRPRGFAFVEFQDRGHAEQAIRSSTAQAFNGRPLAVSEARAREDRGPGGPRPGGGGFGGPRPRRLQRRRADSAARVPAAGSAAPRLRSAVRLRRPGEAATSAPMRSHRRGPGAKKKKKDAERPRGPIPTKFTGRSFSLDDDKDAVQRGHSGYRRLRDQQAGRRRRTSEDGREARKVCATSDSKS